MEHSYQSFLAFLEALIELSHSLDEFVSRFPICETSPMCRTESLRHFRPVRVSLTDRQWYDEWDPIRNLQGAIRSPMPFAPKIAFQPPLRVRRNDRHKKRAVPDVTL